MTNDLIQAKYLLETEGFTCVLCNHGELRTSTARGVQPLTELLKEGRFQGFCAADKVVGKATAFLYVLLGVQSVYTPVASEAAIRLLTEHHIQIYYDMAVPVIFNRSRTGFCPMETAVQDIEDPQLALQAIENALARMLHKQI